MRRADRFSKMAVLAAHDALKGLDALESGLTGVIVVSAFGPHPTTFKFLDNILDYKENEVSPTLFSHSVHNAAASYIAMVLKINGPTLTVTRFSGALAQGLVLADCWLRFGVCARVLLVVAEERAAVFNAAFNNREGAVCFTLELQGAGLCGIKNIEVLPVVSRAPQVLESAIALARSAFLAQESPAINDCHDAGAVIKLGK